MTTDKGKGVYGVGATGMLQRAARRQSVTRDRQRRPRVS